MGPLMTLEVQAAGQTFGIGDVIRQTDQQGDHCELHVRIQHHSSESRRDLVPCQALTLIMESNLGELYRGVLADGSAEFSHTISTKGLVWLRVRLHGILRETLSTLAFTNPIYFGTAGGVFGMRWPQIIAHTGCEGTPDNTLESSLAGRNAGAEVLEVDVRATKDGICVLYHDDHPSFAELTYEELRVKNALHLPAGSELERLETVLLEFKGQPVSFNLDLKNNEAAAPTLRLLDALDMWEQVFFTGVTDSIVNLPYRSRVMWNTPESLKNMDSASYEAIAQNICQMVKQEGYAGINVDYPSCRDYLVQCAHEHDLRVWIYTLPDSSLFRKFAEMKVDAVSTLDVSAIAALRSKMKTSSSS